MRRRQLIAAQAAASFQQPKHEVLTNETPKNAENADEKGRQKEVLKVCPNCQGSFKNLGVHFRFCKKA